MYGMGAESCVILFILLKDGKKPGAREGVRKSGISKECHITVPEVSSERTRTLGSSPHYHVEA